MGVTRSEILRIAELAELEVDAGAAAELETQLTRILDYVARLGELPPEGGDEDGARSVRLRRDVVAPDPLQRPVSEFAPSFRSGLFVVPKLGEPGQEESS